MRQRKLNLKLLLWLAGTFAVCGVLVAWLHYYQVHRSAVSFLEQAEHAREKGDAKEAAMMYRRYVKFRPEDAEGYASWAEVLSDIAASPDAEPVDIYQANKVLEQAVSKLPERADLRRRLVDLTMKYGQFKTALDHVRALLAGAADEVEAKVLYGRCLTGVGQYEQAIAAYYELIGYDRSTKTFDPDKAPGRQELQPYTDSAELLRIHFNSPEIGDQIMDQMVEANPENFSAFLERGRYRLRRNQLAEAKQDVAQALAMEPNDVEILLTASELAINEKDYASARSISSAAWNYIATTSGSTEIWRVDLHEHNDIDAALAHIGRGLENLPQSVMLLRHQADLQLQNEDVEAVQETIRAMREAGVDRELLEYLKTRILIIDGKWITAARQLERLRPLLVRQPDLVLQIDLLAGRCYEMLGQADRAIEAYRRALNADARLDAAREGVERMMLATGQTKTKRARLDRSVAEMLRRPANRQDWAEIDTLVDQHVRERGLSEAQGQILRAEVMTMRQEVDTAEQILAAARQKFPDDVQIVLAQSQLAWRGNDDGRQAALAVLEKASDGLGDRAELRLAKAMILVAQPGDEARRKLTELEENLEEIPEEASQQLLRGLGQVYFQSGKFSDARRTWAALAAMRPDDLPDHLKVFQAALEETNQEAMQQAVAAVEKLLGTRNDPVWQYCEAARQIAEYAEDRQEKRLLEEAQQLVDLAMKSRPTWHELYLLQASIHLFSGRHDEAINSFQRAFELGPPPAKAVRRLVELLSIQSRFAEAERAMELLDSRSRRIIPTELQSEIKQRTGDLARAVRLAEESVLRDPENGVKQVWYGQILLRNRQFEDALQAFRRAVELESETSQIWLTLIYYLVDSGQQDEALKEIERAKASIPEEQIPFFLGYCSEYLKQPEEAEKHFLAAHESNPSDLAVIRKLAQFYLSPRYFRDDGAPRAEGYLKQIIATSSESTSSPENVAWARRMLARVLHRRGTYPDLQQALELLKENAVDGRMRPEDVVLSATILAVRPERVSRLEAVRLLEQAHEARGLQIVEQLVLAQLYYQADEWRKCQEQMQDMLGDETVNPAVLTAYCRMLLERDEIGQAQLWIRRLQDLNTGSSTTLQLAAQLLVKQGRAAEAVQVVEAGFVNGADGANADNLQRAARMLEQIEQYDAAEKMFRRGVEADPVRVLELARFLGQRGDVAEAFEHLKEATRVRPLPEVTQVAVLMLRERRAEVGDRYDRQVESWLKEAASKYPKSNAVQIQFAIYYDLKGDHAREEKVYRELLARSDFVGNRRALVLNNLAFSLALRGHAAEGGVPLVNEALEIHGPTGALLDTRAVVHWSLGNFESALADLREAIRDEPKPVRYFHMALVQLAMGNKQAAHAAYLEAQQRGLKLKDISVLERQHYDQLVRELGIDAKEQVTRAPAARRPARTAA